MTPNKPYMLRRYLGLRMFLAVLATAPSARMVLAQSAPAADPAAAEEAIVLNPFEVRTSSDVGYEARETLAGSRMNSSLKDIASQVNVFTPEFMRDLGLTDLNSAMAYSLNSETDDQIVEVGAPGNAGVGATSRPFSASGGGGGGGGRTRGLLASNRTHDFFDTFTPIDTYNTERLTFASGPNSILFGNGSPAGTIDTTFLRPLLARKKYHVDMRVDSLGGDREMLDLNQPLVKNKVGIRVASLRDRQKDWREPGFSNQDRLYAALLLKPFEKVSVSAYYEHASIHNQPIRNTLLQDHVTSWTSTGSVPYNNGGTGALPPAPATSPYQARAAAANARPYYIFDGSGAVLPVALGSNTVTVRGYDTFFTAPNNFERSIIDERLYPYDLAYSGNSDQTKMRSSIRGGSVDVSPVKNLYIQLGLNLEEYRHRSADLLNNIAAELHVDPNLYLSDRTTPNPYFGRYFIENQVPISVKNYGLKDQRRVSVSYDLNFTERRDWAKWLGRHRLAGLADRLDSSSIYQRSDFRVVGDYPFTSAAGPSRVINFRQYLDPGHMTVNLPYDPLADGLITLPGTNVKIASWDPGVTPNVPEANRSVTRSWVLATQSSFLNDRVVVFMGQRSDNVDVQSATLPTNVPFETMVTGDVPWTTVNKQKPVTRARSIVVHPLNWVSAFYSRSDSEQVAALIRRDLTGSLALTGAGKGEEFGFSVGWKGRLTLRVSKYRTSSVGTPSALRAPTPTPSPNNKGNQIRFDLPDVERTVQLAGETSRSAKYGAYQDEIASVRAAANWTQFDVYDVLSDRVAEGYEATLIGNPTPNWRLAVSVAKNRTRESNIAPQFFDFIQERLPIWSKYLATPIHNQTQLTVGGLLGAAVQNWNYIRLADGQYNQQEREYKVVATTRYTVPSGRLRGVFGGGTYSWSSPAAVGYQQISITDNPFVVPGITASAITVNDRNQPIRGGGLNSFDAFAGYSRKIWQRRIDWRLQLNIRNLLDRDGLLVQRATTTGQGAIFTAPAPRTFILTSSFTY